MESSRNMEEVKVFRPNVWQFETQDKQNEAVCTKIFDEIHDAVTQEGVARIALSSSEAVMDVFQKISKDSLIPWDQTEVYQVDEKMAEKKTISRPIIEKLGGSDFFRDVKDFTFFDDGVSVTQSLQNYEQKLSVLDGALFDVVVVEINKDGSFAGLFCESEGLTHQDNQYTTSVKNILSVNETVLTFNIETILSSKTIIAIVKGEEKAEVLNDLFDPGIKAVDFPAKFLLASPNLHFYVWIN